MLRRLMWSLVVLTAVTACTSTVPRAVRAPGRRSSAASLAAPLAGPSRTSLRVRAAWVVDRDVLWVLSDVRLARSVDGGRSWQSVTPRQVRRGTEDRTIDGLAVIDARHAWLVYGGIASGAPLHLLVTADGGHDWRQVGPPLNPNCTMQAVSPRVGWCVELGGAAGSMGVVVRRTTDGGRHWRLESRRGPDRSTPGALPFGCDKIVHFDGVRRGWAPFLCAAGPPQLYRTSDAGRTWHPARVAGPGVPGSEGEFLGYPVVSGPLGAVGYEQDSFPSTGPMRRRVVVYRTADGGASWRPVRVPGPPRRWQVDVLSPSRWRLLSGRTLLATDDAGRTWQQVMTDRSFAELQLGWTSALTLEFVGARTAWLHAGSSLWHSTDAGRHWSRVVVR